MRLRPKYTRAKEEGRQGSGSLISTFLMQHYFRSAALFPDGVLLFLLPPFRFYRAYLKILVFPFYKAQFGCSPSHVQIPRCIESLHASIKRKLTNACTLYMHACIYIGKQKFLRKTKALIGCSCKQQKVFHHSPSTLVDEIFE